MVNLLTDEGRVDCLIGAASALLHYSLLWQEAAECECKTVQLPVDLLSFPYLWL